jgi:hypothetical protein
MSDEDVVQLSFVNPYGGSHSQAYRGRQQAKEEDNGYSPPPRNPAKGGNRGGRPAQVRKPHRPYNPETSPPPRNRGRDLVSDTPLESDDETGTDQYPVRVSSARLPPVQRNKPTATSKQPASARSRFEELDLDRERNGDPRNQLQTHMDESDLEFDDMSASEAEAPVPNPPKLIKGKTQESQKKP